MRNSCNDADITRGFEILYSYEDNAIQLFCQKPKPWRISSCDEEQQLIGLRKVGGKVLPSRTRDNSLDCGGLGTARHYEKIRGAFDLARDADERSAELEAVVYPVRIVIACERLERGNFTSEITDHHEALSTLGETDTDCGVGGGNRIVRDNEDRRERAERWSHLAPGAFVRTAWSSRRCHSCHCFSSYTQYCRPASLPTLSASSRVE